MFNTLGFHNIKIKTNLGSKHHLLKNKTKQKKNKMLNFYKVLHQGCNSNSLIRSNLPANCTASHVFKCIWHWSFTKEIQIKQTPSPLLYIFFHKLLVELGAQRVIDEALLFPCLVHSFGAVFEHDVIIPPRRSEIKEIILFLITFIQTHWEDLCVRVTFSWLWTYLELGSVAAVLPN